MMLKSFKEAFLLCSKRQHLQLPEQQQLQYFQWERPILNSTLVNAEVMEKTVLNINSIQKQNWPEEM